MDVAHTILATEFDPAGRGFFARVHEQLRRAAEQEGPRNSLVDICIEKLIAGGRLEDDEATAVFKEIIHGELAEDQIGALLVVLQPDILSASNLAAFAQVLRACSAQVRPTLQPGEVLSDTCGTGSDTFGTFNVSTTIMFILAAAGIKIAKHGNRAITSQCGSADVLSALEIRIDLEAHQVEDCINDVGVGFMFAPLFHRAVQNVQRIRRLLAEQMPLAVKARTVFNVLGPLANPAAAVRQIIGVYSVDLVPKLAEALRHLGMERAIVAFGHCDGSAIGLDEFSTVGPTTFAELRGGEITLQTITPEEVGLPRLTDPTKLAGGKSPFNARILTDILSGTEQGPRMDLALFNAGAGLYLGNITDSIAQGITEARRIIAKGDATEKLLRFQAKTQQF